MKNPLEYTLLEIDTAMHVNNADYETQKALGEIVRWVREHQRSCHAYAVQKEMRAISTPKELQRRKIRELEAEVECILMPSEGEQ